MLELHGFTACSFSLLHLNIRSLECNLHNLTNLLNNLNIKFSVIGISETWLKNCTHSVDIEGYNFFHKHREDKMVRVLVCTYRTALLLKFVVI